MSDGKLDVMRKLAIGFGWLYLMAPLVRALTALVLTWTANAADPITAIR